MRTNADHQSEIWIGMVEVRPFNNSKLLADADGAFVNVLTWAVDLDEFRRKSEELMAYLHLEVVAMDKVGPLADRGPEEELEESIRALSR